MEAIITACISAAAVIVSSILTWNHYMRETSKDVIEIKGQANNRQSEHKDLSKEHKDLSKEHKGIEDRIVQLLLEQQKQQTSREEAAKQLPQEETLFKIVEGVYVHASQLASENSRLKELAAQQQKQIETQQKQIKKLKQRISSRNLDEELER